MHTNPVLPATRIQKHHANSTLTTRPHRAKPNLGNMTTNDKARTGGRRACLGTLGRGFSHDDNSARCFSREPSMPARSNPDTPVLFPPHRRSFLFAFLSQTPSKTAAAHSTHSDERNTTQLIENTHNRCAPLDTLIASRGIVIREGILSRKGKHAEGKSVATRTARNAQLRHNITERDGSFLARRISRDSSLPGHMLI
jgi:hypothetical protein